MPEDPRLDEWESQYAFPTWINETPLFDVVLC
jgi:hypothetical protein